MVQVLDAIENARSTEISEIARGARTLQIQRVLHLINGEVFSGAERVQQLLGKRLPAFGFDPIFACLKPGKFAECCELPSEQLWSEPMRHRRDIGIADRIASRAMGSGVRLLHAHTPRTAMIAHLVAGKTGLPWVYHVHSPTVRDSTRTGRNWFNDAVERWSLRSAHRIITVSKSLRREMLRRGYSHQRVVAIANGVAEQDPISPYDRLNESQWRLGMVALIRPRKGIEVLLEALQNVVKSQPNVTLDVIGGFETTEYESQVLGLTQRLGLANQVRWRGFTRDVQGALRELDALVLPSLFGEGMPMVVLEAMAVGVPVIATSVEGTPEVVRDGREGYLAQPRDPVSLAKSIERLIADRSAWCSLSEGAWLRHREAFTDSRMAERVARAYERTLNELVPQPIASEMSLAWASPHARRLQSFLAEC